MASTIRSAAVDLNSVPASVLIRAASQRAAKRLFDLTIASISLFLLLPLLIAIFLFVRRDGGPAFYAQRRVGRNRREFRCWKFRTMAVDADDRLQKLLAQDPAIRDEFERFQKLRADPRICPGGHFLRVHSLDELPQLFNVLRGDMSIVGPRPRPVNEFRLIEQSSNRSDHYTSVRPGLTGLWQVTMRSDCTLEEKVKIDCRYVETMSFLGDLTIIIRTFPLVLNGRGAA